MFHVITISESVYRAVQSGIIFLDEVDKIAWGGRSGPDVIESCINITREYVGNKLDTSIQDDKLRKYIL